MSIDYEILKDKILNKKFDELEIDELKRVHKTCTKCEQTKTLDFYSKCKKGRFGRHAQCKECMNKVSIMHYSKKLEKEGKMRKNDLDCIIEI